MNELPRHPVLSASPSRTTQAAEGLLRWRWSVAEVEEMVKAGILLEQMRHWTQRLPHDIFLIQETTFRMNEDTFVEPDFVFYRRSDGLRNLNPATALLVVEVADTTLSFDLGRKARIYAAFGVRELWVINAEMLLTRVHREPGLEGYRQTTEVPPTAPLMLDFAPALSVTLSDLELI